MIDTLYVIQITGARKNKIVPSQINPAILMILKYQKSNFHLNWVHLLKQ